MIKIIKKKINMSDELKPKSIGFANLASRNIKSAKVDYELLNIQI